MDLSFFNAFLAMLNKAFRSRFPGCNGGSVESNMNSVKGVWSSCRVRMTYSTRMTGGSNASVKQPRIEEQK